jgi:hypothetical protein
VPRRTIRMATMQVLGRVRVSDCSRFASQHLVVNPPVGDLAQIPEIKSLSRRRVFNESPQFKTSRVIRGCMGCFVQQRRRSDDAAAVYARTTQRYECAPALGDRGPMDQLDCRSVGFITAQSMESATRQPETNTWQTSLVTCESKAERVCRDALRRRRGFGRRHYRGREHSSLVSIQSRRNSVPASTLVNRRACRGIS